jgi:hypothetical protein
MTPSSNETLERIARRIPIPEPAYERMLRRRDRKRRNQRIAAGVVGIAVFVAAVWIVTSGLSLDRSEKSVGPAGEVTGPAETGPAETGPAETGPAETAPVIGNTGDPSSVGFGGLPPEGATPSTPLRGELVMKSRGGGLGSPWHNVNVYADGRLIWSRQSTREVSIGRCCTVPRWIEQRLTPEGVELLRSGAVPLGGQYENPAQGLPASAWEDRTFRPFVPARYEACLWDEPPFSIALDVLPAEAKELLRRSPERGDATSRGWAGVCRELTLEDARVLVEILSDAGFELDGDQREEQPTAGGPGGFLMVTEPEYEVPAGRIQYVGIQFEIILPDGRWYGAAA